MDPNEGDMLPAIGEIDDFSVTAQAGLQFSLSYTDAANATGHEVEVRPLGASLWTVIELAGTSITIGVTFPGRTYEFRVRGTSGDDYGPWSNIATATARLL